MNFFSNNGGNTHPIAINDAGDIGGYFIKGFDSQWRGGIWKIDAKDPRKSTLITLPILPGGDPTTASAIPFAFNKSNQAAGWSSNSAIGQHAAFWKNDAAHTAVELPLLPGDNYGSASLINSSGTIIGWSAYDEPGTWNVGPSKIVIWIGGTVYDLQSLVAQSTDGWTINQVMSINNLGQIAAIASHNGVFRAVVLNPL